jgi:hypothetical protein
MSIGNGFATPSTSFEQTTMSTASPSTCSPGGGQPTGSATPLAPMTLCCGQ